MNHDTHHEHLPTVAQPSSTEWKEPLERAQEESASRPERLARLHAKTNELFPSQEQASLRAEIARSFQVPQWGDYHNEGMLMDRHFEEILLALERTEKGDLPTSIPEEDRLFMQKIAIDHHDALQKYVFLHDISKADLLRIEKLPEAGQKKGEAWEGTLEQWYTEASVPLEAQTNPSALQAFLLSANFKSVSYYHQGMEMHGRKTEASKHGEDGKSKLETMENVGVSPAVLEAIERHEVAYQFETIKVDTYKKYFESLSPEERGLALVASFVDTMGSWKREGASDLKNFLALLDSKQNYEAIQVLEQAIATHDTTHLEKRKMEAFLLALHKQATRIHENTDTLLARFLHECKPTEYDFIAFRQNLDALVASKEFSQEETDEVFLLVQQKDTASVGKKFGKKMKSLAVALKASEKA